MKSFMKSLKEYIYEGLLDRVKNKEVSHDALIKEFLEANYVISGSYDIKVTKNGSVVDVKGDAIVKNDDIVSLTNEFFKFGKVSRKFDCDGCKSLQSLKGAPEKVGWDFSCHECKSLKTLEGAPEKVGVGCDFICSFCDSLKSLKGVPEKIGESFYCRHCNSLKTLKDAPKEVRGNFYCGDRRIKFTEEDVKKYTVVLGAIYVS